MKSQNTEYKESWHEEYLKWICGYANAEGGTLYIGMTDKGKIVGLAKAGQLLETIPNKVRDILGIMVAVNLRESKAGDYLEIIVDPYPSPVSDKGQYHYRSGSTKQELKGAALDRFLLRKQGRTWDSVPVPGVGIKDLSSEAVRQFRDLAKEGGRRCRPTGPPAPRPRRLSGFGRSLCIHAGANNCDRPSGTRRELCHTGANFRP